MRYRPRMTLHAHHHEIGPHAATIGAKDSTKCPKCGATGFDWHRERGANGWENWCSKCGFAESGSG